MKFIFSAVVLSLFFAGCSEKLETPTKGKAVVYCDESVYPLVSVLADSFNTLYPDAEISVKRVTAREAIARMVNGESEIAIAARGLNEEEESAALANKIDYKTVKFVYDGIAVVAGFDFPNVISFDSLLAIIKGENSGYTAVLPGINSSVYEFLKYDVFEGQEIASAILTDSDSAVIAAVLRERKSIGLVSWLNAVGETRLKKIEIGAREQIRAENLYFQPHPGFFVQNLYPLTRLVSVYLAEINIGTASGFTTFLTSNIGQAKALEYQFGPAAVPVKIRE
ncbi:MAG: Phosphate-binding protein PstS [Ignavibacteriaceae bacterium]|nr:Phosphate-binding protein PstS [Ignavibacteriaceae bacterium]